MNGLTPKFEQTDCLSASYGQARSPTRRSIQHCCEVIQYSKLVLRVRDGTLPALDVVLDLLYCVVSMAFLSFDDVQVHPILDLLSWLDYSVPRFSYPGSSAFSSAFPGTVKRLIYRTGFSSSDPVPSLFTLKCTTWVFWGLLG